MPSLDRARVVHAGVSNGVDTLGLQNVGYPDEGWNLAVDATQPRTPAFQEEWPRRKASQHFISWNPREAYFSVQYFQQRQHSACHVERTRQFFHGDTPEEIQRQAAHVTCNETTVALCCVCTHNARKKIMSTYRGTKCGPITSWVLFHRHNPSHSSSSAGQPKPPTMLLLHVGDTSSLTSIGGVGACHVGGSMSVVVSSQCPWSLSAVVDRW